MLLNCARYKKISHFHNYGEIGTEKRFCALSLKLTMHYHVYYLCYIADC